MISAQISKRLEAEFCDAEVSQVEELFKTYRHGEADRVFNTILDLAGGDIRLVRSLVSDANRDPRDVLSAHRSVRETRQARFFIWLLVGIFALYGIVRWVVT